MQFNNGLRLAGISAFFLLGFSEAAKGQAHFQGLGPLDRAIAVSADGSVVVGSITSPSSEQDAAIWTANGGLVPLGHLDNANPYTTARSISGDGTIVVGNSAVGKNLQAFRWTSATGLVSLGNVPNGMSDSVAFGVSADGKVIVGYGTNHIGTGVPTRYTSAAGMQALTTLPGEACAVSADGSVVVGGDNSQAFRWTAAGGIVSIAPGIARTVSADGSTLAFDNIVSGNNTIAYRWNQRSGIVNLGNLGSPIYTVGWGSSADGSVIVGTSDTSLQFNPAHAFIWDASHHMRDLNTVLATDYGLGSALQGWTLTAAYAITPDGRTIVGTGTDPAGNGEGWIVTLPEPGSLSLLCVCGLLLARRQARR